MTSLRAMTDKEKLIVKENTLYGFRRNLWGQSRLASSPPSSSRWPAVAVAAGFAAAALPVWLITVDDDWVREAADAYARRLMPTATRLPAYK